MTRSIYAATALAAGLAVPAFAQDIYQPSSDMPVDEQPLGDLGDQQLGSQRLTPEQQMGQDQMSDQMGQVQAAPLRLKLSELPPQVRDELRREAKGGGTIQDVRVEVRGDGMTVFKAQVVKQGKATNVDLAADGTVLERNTAQLRQMRKNR